MKGINKEELHDIFRGIANKEEQQFNRLYEKYKRLVYGISFSILKNREDSQDMVQVVFSKIWSMEEGYLPTNHEASWLYCLTKNETLNFLRKQKNTVNMEGLYYVSEEDYELKAIVEKETFNKILSRLEEKDQEIVSLKILSNLSFKEISNMLDMPIGTVQWRYYKALHTLKTLLGSVSMYLVTMLVWITKRFGNRTEKGEPILEEKEDQETEVKEEIEDDETTKKTPQETESAKTESAEVRDEIQEVITVKKEENMNIPPIEIGLLSLASIFLIITIIFLFFFIKHQQRAKKNVSK